MLKRQPNRFYQSVYKAIDVPGGPNLISVGSLRIRHDHQGTDNVFHFVVKQNGSVTLHHVSESQLHAWLVGWGVPSIDAQHAVYDLTGNYRDRSLPPYDPTKKRQTKKKRVSKKASQRKVP